MLINCWIAITFLLLMSLEVGVWALRILSVDVPRIALAGESQSALLQCSYDLEGDVLYSVRWYRDEFEFYRYTPRVEPFTKVFSLPGAKVDLTHSDDHQVLIVNLNRQLSGVYSCEVSTDAPGFHTNVRSARLTVVDMPLHGPLLSVSRPTYARDDVLQANCSAGDAYPAPNITWLLDGHKIAEVVSKRIGEPDIEKRNVFSQIEITIQDNHNEHTRWSLNDVSPQTKHLRYVMEPPASSQFTISCVATIFDVYKQSSEVNIKEEILDQAPISNGKSLGVGAICDCWAFLILLHLFIADTLF